MNWFYNLFGEDETLEVIEKMRLEKGDSLTFKDKSFKTGTLIVPDLETLRNLVDKIEPSGKPNSVGETVVNVQELYTNKLYEHATFQVASQFNLLEMANPNLTPADGVSIYEYDPTQGPKSAIACGASTIMRNYFSQSTEKQLNTLEKIEEELVNCSNRYWTMKNGYALLDPKEVGTLNLHLNSIDKDRLKSKLKVGVQQDAQVTLNNCSHTVTQVFCSAMPISYVVGGISEFEEVEPAYKDICMLILEATYEAAVCAAILNQKSDTLFLTLVGGGAFGNDPKWIVESIEKALRKYPDYGLNVQINSYLQSNPLVQKLLI